MLLLSNDAVADLPQYTSQDAIVQVRSATPPRSMIYRERQKKNNNIKQ